MTLFSYFWQPVFLYFLPYLPLFLSKSSSDDLGTFFFLLLSDMDMDMNKIGGDDDMNVNRFLCCHAVSNIPQEDELLHTMKPTRTL